MKLTKNQIALAAMQSMLSNTAIMEILAQRNEAELGLRKDDEKESDYLKRKTAALAAKVCSNAFVYADEFDKLDKG